MQTREVDPVFLGLTRPAMMMGVTQSFFIINGMINLIIFLAVNSFLPVIILFPLLHGIGYLACLRDPRPRSTPRPQGAHYGELPLFNQSQTLWCQAFRYCGM